MGTRQAAGAESLGNLRLDAMPIFLGCAMCVACKLLVPRPRVEPVPPAVEARRLNHWTAREVSLCPIFVMMISLVPSTVPGTELQ